MDERVEGTARGFDRLVFFSDAVVAIASTLLILPVVESVSDSEQTLYDLLWRDGKFVVFLVSFAVIARFWIVHHAMFERIERYSSVLVWANMAWLASIVFLPVPTELIGVRGTDDAGVRFLYLFAVFINSAMLLLVDVVIVRNPRLWIGDRLATTEFSGGLATVVLLALATVIGTAVEAIGLWALVLLMLSSPLAKWIDRRREPAQPEPEAPARY